MVRAIGERGTAIRLQGKRVARPDLPTLPRLGAFLSLALPNIREAGAGAVTLSPAMLEYLRARCGDVPEIRLLLEENERLREAMRDADELLAGMWSYSEEGRANLSHVWYVRASNVLRGALGERKP